MIIPIKAMENHKPEIVSAFNRQLGEPDASEDVRKEADQTWGSLIKSRFSAKPDKDFPCAPKDKHGNSITMLPARMRRTCRRRRWRRFGPAASFRAPPASLNSFAEAALAGKA